MITTETKPFENKEVEEKFYLKIERILSNGGKRWLTNKQEIEIFEKKKGIILELARRGLLTFKEKDVILSPDYANSINDIHLIDLILRLSRYTKGSYVYDIAIKKLIPIEPIQA